MEIISETQNKISGYLRGESLFSESFSAITHTVNKHRNNPEWIKFE
jgi:hypothetical protein